MKACIELCKKDVEGAVYVIVIGDGVQLNDIVVKDSYYRGGYIRTCTRNVSLVFIFLSSLRYKFRGRNSF